MFDNIPAWLNVAMGFVAFAAVIGAAVVVIISAVRKQSTEELKGLAETRGKTIDDLQSKVEQLERTVQNQQGQIDMLRQMKTQEIIEGVVQGIKKELK